MSKREINFFNIAFLDLLSGALAAVLILFVIVPKLDSKLVEEIEEFKKLEVEVKEVKDMIEKLEDSVDKELYEKLEKKIGDMEETIAGLKKTVENLRREKERLEEELAKCREETEKLKTEIEELKEEVESLKTKVKSLEEDLEATRARAAKAERSLALTKKLDIVFVLDCTSSMEEEINDMKANLKGTIRVLQKTVESIYVGFVAFRDQGDAFVTREFPLTNMESGGLDRLMSFVDGLSAEGGGDVEEAVLQAMQAAGRMAWRADVKQVMVLVGDAPAHAPEVPGCYSVAEDFRRRPTKSKVSSVYANERDNFVDFFQTVASRGGGDFVRNQGRMMESILLSVMD